MRSGSPFPQNWTPAAPSHERSIVIDPWIAFGRPIVQRKGISTSTIVERVDSGESIREIAADYELGQAEVEQAILYERAARRSSISRTVI